jgi:ferrochelatase
VIQNVNERRNRQSAVLRARTHRELVAEVTRGRVAHAGDAQVLAEERNEFDVEVVERRDAIELTRAREIAHGVDHGLAIAERRHREHLVDVFARPRFIEQRLGSEEHHVAPFALCTLEEAVALEVTGDTENGEWLGLGHDPASVSSPPRRPIDDLAGVFPGHFRRNRRDATQANHRNPTTVIPSPRTEILVTAHGTVTSLDELPAFLQVIRRGRAAPPDVVNEVRRRYEAIGGRSPLLEITLAQAKALEAAVGLPTRVAMRLWSPRIEDVVKQMAGEGVQRIVSVPVAPYSTHVYDAAIEAAVHAAGASIEVVRVGAWNMQPALLAAFGSAALEAYRAVPADARTAVLWSAHSLPMKAIESGDPYARLVEETARGAWTWLQAHGVQTPFRQIFQSQGMTNDAWLGPDLPTALHALKTEGITHAIVAPIGFLSDHVEILYDLDIEAAQLAHDLGLSFSRTRTLNDDPALVEALASAVRPVL